MFVYSVRSFEPWTWGSRLTGIVLLVVLTGVLILALQRANR